MDLSLHLEEFKRHPEKSEAAELMLRELKKHFKKYTDPSGPEYEPVFIIATAFDPRYRRLLNAVRLIVLSKSSLRV